MNEALELHKADIEKKATSIKPAGTKAALVREVRLLGEVNINGPFIIPPDTTINQIIYNFGGGIPLNKKIKAVQFGLENGICLNQADFGLTLENALKKVGFSGKLDKIVIISNEVNLVKHAEQSLEKIIMGLCGKCIPCREGTKRVHEVIKKIVDGLGEDTDIELLIDLINTIKETSLCRLGKVSINTVESTLAYFIDEYIALIKINDSHSAKVKSAKDDKENLLRKAQIA